MHCHARMLPQWPALRAITSLTPQRTRCISRICTIRCVLTLCGWVVSYVCCVCHLWNTNAMTELRCVWYFWFGRLQLHRRRSMSIRSCATRKASRYVVCGSLTLLVFFFCSLVAVRWLCGPTCPLTSFVSLSLCLCVRAGVDPTSGCRGLAAHTQHRHHHTRRVAGRRHAARGCNCACVVIALYFCLLEGAVGCGWSLGPGSDLVRIRSIMRVRTAVTETRWPDRH